MGYASYTLADGREAGYAVKDVCNEHGCTSSIDRGLDYLCGEVPGGQEGACSRYFCSLHLFFSDTSPGQRCKRCIELYPDYEEDELEEK